MSPGEASGTLLPAPAAGGREPSGSDCRLPREPCGPSELLLLAPWYSVEPPNNSSEAVSSEDSSEASDLLGETSGAGWPGWSRLVWVT